MTLLRVYVGPEPEPRIVDAVREGGGTLVALDEADAVVWLEPSPSGFPRHLPESVTWVQLPAAGIGSWLEEGLVTDDIDFTSARGVYSHTVAEHTLALMLAAVRKMSTWTRRTAWEPETVGTLRGATVTILGAGGIGRALIPMLTPLQSEVIAVTRSGEDVPGAARTFAAEELDAVWPLTDVLVLAAPATPATRHIVDARVLRALPDHAWVVNVARGSLIDHDALVDAVRNGQIAGAALDVTDPEPLPSDHPLWGLDDVLITPHVANPVAELLPRLAERIQENVRRRVAGEPLIGRIEPERGF